MNLKKKASKRKQLQNKEKKSSSPPNKHNKSSSSVDKVLLKALNLITITNDREAISYELKTHDHPKSNNNGKSKKPKLVQKKGAVKEMIKTVMEDGCQEKVRISCFKRNKKDKETKESKGVKKTSMVKDSLKKEQQPPNKKPIKHDEANENKMNNKYKQQHAKKKLRNFVVINEGPSKDKSYSAVNLYKQGLNNLSKDYRIPKNLRLSPTMEKKISGNKGRNSDATLHPERQSKPAEENAKQGVVDAMPPKKNPLSHYKTNLQLFNNDRAKSHDKDDVASSDKFKEGSGEEIKAVKNEGTKESKNDTDVEPEATQPKENPLEHYKSGLQSFQNNKPSNHDKDTSDAIRGNSSKQNKRNGGGKKDEEADGNEGKLPSSGSLRGSSNQSSKADPKVELDAKKVLWAVQRVSR